MTFSARSEAQKLRWENHRLRLRAKQAERAAAAWISEMEERAVEMRALVAPRPPHIKTLKSELCNLGDQAMFEAAWFELQSSAMADDCWIPEAAAPFAALLVRIVEQTAAEFGAATAQRALRALANAMNA